MVSTYVAQSGDRLPAIGVETTRSASLPGSMVALAFPGLPPRGIKGMGAQGFEHGNALIRTKNLTGGCQAVDADPNGQQRSRRDDGESRGDHHEAAIQRGVHGSIRRRVPPEQIPVAVAR